MSIRYSIAMQPNDPSEWLTRIESSMARFGLTNEALAEMSGISKAQIGRIRSGQTRAPRNSTVESIERALKFEGSARLVPREFVASMRVKALPPHRALHELLEFRDSAKVEFPRPLYGNVPTAPAQARTLAQERRPLNLDALNELAGSLGVAAFEHDMALATLRKTCGRLRERLLPTIAVDIELSDDQLAALDQWCRFLNGPAPTRNEQTGISIVFVLAGRTSNEDRARLAVELYQAQRPAPLVVLLGAPALGGGLLLGEADAAYVTFTRLRHVRSVIDWKNIIVDNRTNSFRDAAALAPSYTSRVAFDSPRSSLPTRVALIAGKRSMRRAWWLFDQALAERDHLVDKVIPHPQGADEIPLNAEYEVQRLFMDSVVAETEKLLLARLLGHA